jgi:hypothetical protein
MNALSVRGPLRRVESPVAGQQILHRPAHGGELTGADVHDVLHDADHLTPLTWVLGFVIRVLGPPFVDPCAIMQHLALDGPATATDCGLRAILGQAQDRGTLPEPGPREPFPPPAARRGDGQNPCLVGNAVTVRVGHRLAS